MFDDFLDLLFPVRCASCERWLTGRRSGRYPVCRECIKSLPVINPPVCERCGIQLISEKRLCMRCRERTFSFDAAHPIWAYYGSALKLIRMYKFSGERGLAGLFAETAATVLNWKFPGLSVVPVPPRRRSRSEHVTMIIRLLKSKYDIHILKLLVRRGGRSQKSLSFEERQRNLRGLIKLNKLKKGRRLPAHVVLFDDVFTTGATADECARVLKSAGVKTVDVVTLAAD